MGYTTQNIKMGEQIGANAYWFDLEIQFKF